MIVKSSSSMNKTNIFWTITLTRGKYHQNPHRDGKWFDYLNLTSIISQRSKDFLSLCLLFCRKCLYVLRLVVSVVKRIRGIWHLSTHFLSPALLCINYDLSLGISKCYSASSLEDKGLKQRKNLQILFIQNWYSESVKTSFIFMTNWLSFMASAVCVATNTL